MQEYWEGGANRPPKGDANPTPMEPSQGWLGPLGGPTVLCARLERPNVGIRGARCASLAQDIGSVFKQFQSTHNETLKTLWVLFSEKRHMNRARVWPLCFAVLQRNAWRPPVLQ